MSIHERFEAGMATCDIDIVASCFHEDFQMIMHSDGGSALSKTDWKKMFGSVIDKLQRENVRCIYENEDIMVVHFIGSFPNGTKDAVMWVGIKKDGLIIRAETGSTRLG